MISKEEKQRVEELEDKIMCNINEIEDDILNTYSYVELPRMRSYTDALRWVLDIIHWIWEE